MATTLSTTVTNAGPFLVSMEHENLCVISIPTDSIPSYAWWLIREYSLDRRKKSSFHSILMDDDGLSLICSVSSTSALESIDSTKMRISPQKWRAFVINVFGSATEFPGVVHYLADSLSRAGLSILHISTFEYEVFLVQEQDIDKACAVFRRSDSPTELLTFIQGAQKKRTSSGGGNHVSTTSTGIGQSTTGHSSSQSYINDSTCDPPFKAGFELCVLPGHVMLARLNDNFPLTDCWKVLTNLMLYDERYSPIERLVSKGALSSKSGLSTSGSNPGFLSSITPGVEDLTPVRSRSGSKSTSQSRLNSHNFTGNGNGTTSEDEKKQSDKDINTFMWGLWQCENELTFLVDESDVDSFPEGALTVSPQRWRLIKLGGRQIGFHETGIVTAMSKIDPSIPCLNISTATSNCTLVPEELLEQTLDCLSQSLKCPVREYR